MASRKRRHLTPEDKKVWQSVAETIRPRSDTAPLELGNTSPSMPKPAPPPIPKPAPKMQFIPKPAPTVPKRPPSHKDASQLDGRTDARLRRGRMEPDRTIDLHGMTAAAAQSALSSFLLASRNGGARMVLVITGKGTVAGKDHHGMPRRPGVIRESLPMWLSMPPLAGMVVKTVSAHPRHGGGGAFYVYLRRVRG